MKYEGMSKWIKVNRKQLGLSQRALANLVGVSKQVISNIEREVTSTVHNKTIIALQLAFNDEKYIKNIDTDKFIEAKIDTINSIHISKKFIPVIEVLDKYKIYNEKDIKRICNIIEGYSKE